MVLRCWGVGCGVSELASGGDYKFHIFAQWSVHFRLCKDEVMSTVRPQTVCVLVSALEQNFNNSWLVDGKAVVFLLLDSLWRRSRCTICSMIMSAWGVIFLGLLGIFFYIQAVNLFPDLHFEEEEPVEGVVPPLTTALVAAFISHGLNCL